MTWLLLTNPILLFIAAGIKGLTSLAKTIQYLNKNYRDQVFTIADAKRGDIGNTSQQYARAVFDESSSGMNFDAVTVAPYMGEDSVKPFLSTPGNWIIVLALTSNKGAEDFQFFQDGATRLFERVLINSQQWGNPGNMMYVVGATQAEMLTRVRAAGTRPFPAGSRCWCTRRQPPTGHSTRNDPGMRIDRKLLKKYYLCLQGHRICRCCPERGPENAIGNVRISLIIRQWLSNRVCRGFVLPVCLLVRCRVFRTQLRLSHLYNNDILSRFRGHGSV